MQAFIRRYDDDTPPTGLATVATDIALRCLAPALVWLGVVVGIGWSIMNVLGDLRAEDEINRDLQATRTPAWDTFTQVASQMADTLPTIGLALLAVIVVFALTRKWWIAVLPLLAVSVQAGVFLLVTLLTDRDRPEVPQLDPAPPTSSFPSGHVGATTALYVTFALLAQRIPHAGVRRVLTVVLLLVPLWVAYARMYRGMHHLSDVIIGLINGAVCALLAWGYLRREVVRCGPGGGDDS